MLIFGTGQFAEVVHYYFSGTHRVTGFTVDEPKDSEFKGLPVIPWTEAEPDGIYVAIGPSHLNTGRQKKVKEAYDRGFHLKSFISSAAQVFTDNIGEHALILEHNTVQPYVEIGDNCVLWSGNHVGHHSKIGDHCFISSHVVISGGCEIGNNTFLGVNSCIRDKVKIGSHCIVCMGSVVTHDMPDHSVWIGNELSKVPSQRLKI